MKRAAGILMPISSLPGKYGIGCFSEEAYRFVQKVARHACKAGRVTLVAEGIENFLINVKTN